MNQLFNAFWISCCCFLGFEGQIFAQTCCSGGVPVSSNLGLPATEGNVVQFSLNYDLNVLETLKSGRVVLDDDARSRKTHSLLLQMGYSLTDRFSADLFFSWVRQERTINQFGNRNFTSTNGIGDAVFLIKYKVLDHNNSSTTLTAGAGIKLPTGAADLSDERGITLNADLQPGSGAWDGLFWSQYTQVLGFRPSMSLIATGIYSIRGTNDRYLGTQSYRFGNELQIRAGVSDRLNLGKLLVDPTIIFRYRKVDQDKINDSGLPSTGGEWLFINPGITYWITPGMSTNINAELPLIADITGTQVTPTYRLNIGWYQRIGLRKKEIIINPIFKSDQ